MYKFKLFNNTKTHFKYFESIGSILWYLENSVKKTVSPIHTKINTVRKTVIYNAHTKFELKWKRSLDINILLIIWLPRLQCTSMYSFVLFCTMYSFSYSVKKTINPKVTKIDTIRRRLTYNTRTKFELKRMHRLHTRILKIIWLRRL